MFNINAAASKNLTFFIVPIINIKAPHPVSKATIPDITIYSGLKM